VEGGDDAGDEFEDEDVGEIDGVGPVTDGFEDGEEADEAGALEFDGAEEEEGGESAVEEGAQPGVGDDPCGLACVGVEAIGKDCGEPEDGGEDEDDARSFVESPAAVDVEDGAAGEEFDGHEGEESLDSGKWREAVVEFDQDDGDAPEGDEPTGQPLGDEEEKEEEDEVEVELGGEGPGLDEDGALV